jgi:hypothetical protein
VIDRVEQVGDVLALDGGRDLGTLGMIRVGGSDERALVPRDHEHDPPVLHRVQDDRRLVPDAGSRDDDVYALRRSEPRRPGLVHGDHGIHPRPRRVDDGAAANRQLATAQPVGQLHADHAARLLHEADRARIRYGDGAGFASREQGLEHQPRVVGPAVPVHAGAAQTIRQQPRLGATRAVGAEHPVQVHAADARQDVVRPQARSELPLAHGAVGIDRVDELHGTDEVRREAAEPFPLASRLEDEPDLALLQVAQTAVDQLRRPARRSRGEVGLLHHGHLEAAERSIARDTGTVDAAPDDQEVETLVLEGVQRGLSPGRTLHDGGPYPTRERLSRCVMDGRCHVPGRTPIRPPNCCAAATGRDREDSRPCARARSHRRGKLIYVLRAE